MVSNPKILNDMQTALTALLSLSARYHLYYKDTCRFGLAIAGKIHSFGEQMEGQANALTKRMFLYDGEPVYEVGEVTPAVTIDGMLNELLTLEMTLDASCTQWTRDCWEAGDMTMFHWFQHLSKWQTVGGNGYKGPISWLKKQLWQISKIGLNQYIASQVTK